jgi:Domain of unknown function (DUF1905)/Bacteriocin-protection, YdeI or OmpD-Associated
MEKFRAPIVAADRGGAYVVVPTTVVDALGGGGRIPVRATFDGVEYRGSVASMGGEKVLGVLKAIREQLGKGEGDQVTVTVDRDMAERTVTMPDDLVRALDDAGAREAFDALSYSHQREYVNWVEEAKRPETRLRRVVQMVERVTGS